MGSEESRGRKHKSSKSFVIREVPIHRTKNGNEDGEWGKGKSFSGMEERAIMTDYDAPELVVFLQEDKAAAAKDKCAKRDCECCEEMAETVSSSSCVSKVSDSECRNPRTSKGGFRNLMVMAEGDHPIEGSEEEEEVVRLFDRKHGEWCSCGMATTSMTSRGSSDSISSTHSFTFPILPREWSGSPVRMVEADAASSSRRRRWRKIFCPCCKC